MTTPDLLAIGQVAEATGIAVSAVRYYDELGLVTATSRVGGKRRFSPDAIGRVSFVRRAQEAGLSLDEIASVLDDDAGDWRSIVDAKTAELTERRDRLDTMLALLADLRECGCEAVATCPKMTAPAR